MNIWIVSFCPVDGGVGGFDWYFAQAAAERDYAETAQVCADSHVVRLVCREVEGTAADCASEEWRDAVTASLDADLDGLELTWPALREQRPVCN